MENENANPENETLENQEQEEQDSRTKEPDEVESLKATLKEYQDKYTTLEEKYIPLEKSYKTIQKTLTERSTEDQSSLRTEVSGLKDMIKILAAAQSQGLDVSPDDIDSMPQKQKVDLVKQYEELEKKQKFQREQDSFVKRATEMYNRAETIFGDDIDSLHQIRNLIRNNDMDLAEKKIQKEESKMVKETPETKEIQESEEDRFEKWYQARIKKERKESGMLDAETGLPSGGTLDEKEFNKLWGLGEIDDTPENRKRANALVSKKLKGD